MIRRAKAALISLVVAVVLAQPAAPAHASDAEVRAATGAPAVLAAAVTGAIYGAAAGASGYVLYALLVDEDIDERG